MDIFVRGVGVGHTHTENLIIKKLKLARETEELETEGENAKKPPFGQIFESYFDLTNHYSNNIVITDSDFILTERTCAIAMTADVSFKMEQELRTTSSLARTSSTGGGRVRGNVPESLTNHLGPLAMETGAAAPVAPSSDMRERLGTAPPQRTQPLESRLGRSVYQNRTSSQTVSRRNDPPATTTPASTTGQSTSAVPVEGIESSSVLLWNRPDPSGWGRYKTDMSAKLNMNTLTCREDARKMIGGEGPTVSRLYRIPGVDWLLAKQEQFSSATTPRYVLNGLPQDNTFGPLNTRSLTDVRRRARELTPPARKGKFLAENKPNNKHHKMYRQFAKPPGQAPVEYSRDYPRATSVEGDDKRYAGLKAPAGDSMFAAYDTLDMKAAKYLIVASSDYLYPPRSLFLPDVIFLTAPKLDWGQSACMMISVRRVVAGDSSCRLE